MFRQGPDFSLRDKRLFEIREFEIARVNCNSMNCDQFSPGTTLSITYFSFVVF